MAREDLVRDVKERRKTVMGEHKYKVDFNGEVFAEGMDINTATLLIKTLAETYYEEMRYGCRIALYEDERYKVVNND